MPSPKGSAHRKVNEKESERIYTWLGCSAFNADNRYTTGHKYLTDGSESDVITGGFLHLSLTIFKQETLLGLCVDSRFESKI